MTHKSRRCNHCPIETVVAFLVGLGLQAALKQLEQNVEELGLTGIFIKSATLGIVGYVFYLGLKRLGELYELEKQGVKLHGTALVEPVFYWLVGAAMAAILF